MCGILFAEGGNEKRFREALSLMKYRGPDGTGVEDNRGYWVGHNRLSVLDPTSAGSQPMCSRSGRYLITYNGEIYNFRELAKQEDIQLETNCDTELVIELYEKLGKDMLPLLNGMFAFVILDTLTGRFFVARDRLGIKPLYYSDDGHLTCYCSEVAPIKHLLASCSVDEMGLRQYKKLRTFFRGHTIWAEIKSFPAGSYWESGEEKFVPYWSLNDDPQDPPEEGELKALLESSIQYRTLADVSVGCFLSGGLDSSIIASSMGPVDTWGVGSAEQNEFSWSKSVAGFLGMPHEGIVVTADAYTEMARKMIAARQEPISVPNEPLIACMSVATKQKNTVVLGGEGADELFFGYDRIFSWAESSDWDVAEFDRRYSYSDNGDLEIVEYSLEPFVGNTREALPIVARFFQVSHLHGLLRRLDFASMFASVEARVPFVDHRLVERMAGVPFSFRMRDGVVKWPLKRLYRSRLPYDVLNRPKVGFPVNLAAMLKLPSATYSDFMAFNINALGIES